MFVVGFQGLESKKIRFFKTGYPFSFTQSGGHTVQLRVIYEGNVWGPLVRSSDEAQLFGMKASSCVIDSVVRAFHTNIKK